MYMSLQIYPIKHFQYFLFSLSLLFSAGMSAQITPGVYFSDEENIRNELKISDNYLVLSTYETSPAKFVKTVGGFSQIENDRLVVLFEFNSNYAQDSVQQLSIPFKMDGSKIVLEMKSRMEFERTANNNQELDGQWLFGTRGPDKGQERRGDNKPRKTLKYLQDGRFQWIAYNTESMDFHGTGGGSFISKDGVYQENIEYFSRDNSRVGAKLKFDYTLKGNDWHHQGKNSKGEPMYEIWMRRE